MTDKPSDLLERAAARIEPPGAWTQGTLARDIQKKARWPKDPEATCWCMMGAITAEFPSRPNPELQHLVDWVHKALDGANIADYNDHPRRTQVEVVVALREAARLAREVGE